MGATSSRGPSPRLSKWRLVGRRPWQRLTKSPKILEICITWHFEKNQYKWGQSDAWEPFNSGQNTCLKTCKLYARDINSFVARGNIIFSDVWNLEHDFCAVKVRVLSNKNISITAIFTVYKQFFWCLNLPTTEWKNSLFRQPINRWHINDNRWRNGEYRYCVLSLKSDGTTQLLLSTEWKQTLCGLIFLSLFKQDESLNTPTR